jgi:hypothetical protein
MRIIADVDLGTAKSKPRRVKLIFRTLRSSTIFAFAGQPKSTMYAIGIFASPGVDIILRKNLRAGDPEPFLFNLLSFPGSTVAIPMNEANKDHAPTAGPLQSPID